MKPLDRFCQFMVSNLRDRALEQHELLLKGRLRGIVVQGLQNDVAKLTSEQRELLRKVVTDVVDTALHDLIFAIQDAHDRLLGLEVLMDGTNVAEESGMLHGEPLGEVGWIARFSRFPETQL